MKNQLALGSEQLSLDFQSCQHHKHKACSKCGEIYPETRKFFGQFKNETKAGIRVGFRSVCRICMAKHTKRFDANHPESVARRRATRLQRSQALSSNDLQRVSKLRKILRDKCRFCSTDLLGGGHIDHLTPVARGGTNSPGNLTLCCEACNLAKTSKTRDEFEEWRAQRGLPIRAIQVPGERPDPVLRAAVRTNY